MANVVDDLVIATAAQTSVVTSAVTLLNALHQQLADALLLPDTKERDAVLADLAVKLKANTDSLAQAVIANTAAATEPVTPVVVVPAPVVDPASPTV